MAYGGGEGSSPIDRRLSNHHQPAPPPAYRRESDPHYHTHYREHHHATGSSPLPRAAPSGHTGEGGPSRLPQSSGASPSHHNGALSPHDREQRLSPNALQQQAHLMQQSPVLAPMPRASDERTPPPPAPRAGLMDERRTSHGRSPKMSPRPTLPDELGHLAGDLGHGEAEPEPAGPAHTHAHGDRGQQQQQQQRPRVPPGVHAAYLINSMLGAGAFGTVWMATARESGERCAIKIVERKRQLHEDFSLEPAEAEILKTVHHPNIVKLIDLISTDLSVYLVMELVLGGHLQARLKAQGAYDEAHAKILIRQVVAAVRHLHERNIIHRDIKPENILFSEISEERLEVKLSDFGLSTMKEGRQTTRCGTPSYCAPELLSGEGYGKAVDIWSLGVLTYVVLTGQLPFVGKDRSDLFARIQRGQYTYPPPPAEPPGGRPRSPTSDLAKDLISRLLKLEPMERYSTRETLQHPWLRDDAAAGEDGPTDLTDVDPESLGTVHEMMRRFIAAQRFKRAVLVVIACSRFRRAGAGEWGTPTDEAAGEEAAAEQPHSEGGE